MTLLQQYIARALDVIAADLGDDYNEAESREYLAACGAYPRAGDDDLASLAALIMCGAITHRYEGGCPDIYENTLESPTFACDDSGCVACLIQRDWLTVTLRGDHAQSD